VAILDADKEGYLRSATALIQTMGRAARHVRGKAILYADNMTRSMAQAIEETNRRRAKQMAYNLENNITPESIVKSVDMRLAAIVEADYITVPLEDVDETALADPQQLASAIAQLEAQMHEAARKFEFERAALLRDRIRAFKQRSLGGLGVAGAQSAPGGEGSAVEQPRPNRSPGKEGVNHRLLRKVKK
jgi:excinuclease ABC subunit B